MAWEERRNGQQYYYTKKRIGDKVKSIYLGNGILGHSADLTNASVRQQKIDIQKELACIKTEQDRIDIVVNDYCRHARATIHEGLLALGYHQHRRQWRLQREVMQMTKELEQAEGSIYAYAELFQKAESKNGKEAEHDLNAMREYGERFPAIFENRNVFFTLAINAIVDSTTISEVNRLFMKQLAVGKLRDYGHDKASPLEKSAIEGVILTELRLYFVEQLYSQNLNRENLSPTTADYLERRLSAAHRRANEARLCLANVRRLLARVGVQVNVAQQMVVKNG